MTTLVGNYLIQRWQQKNWHIQQTFLGREKEYLALKELVDELTSLLGARIYHMQRLILSIKMPDAQLLERVLEYQKISKIWNEKLTSFFTRLTILASSSFTQRLEQNLQTRLVEIGILIEKKISDKKSGYSFRGPSVVSIITSLNSLQGAASTFSKDLLKLLESRREEVYYGIYVEYHPENLHLFPTWDLVKALFIRNIDSHSILRPAVDPYFPSLRLRQRHRVN